MPKAIDLTGQRFDRLTVVCRDGLDRGGHYTWICRCDCGVELSVSSNSLRMGHTKSCGCYGAEARLKSNTRHGKTGTPEHNAWAEMIRRCFDPRRKCYEYYGGRGITVCNRWIENFENFYADMGPKPTPKHSIDRIDVNGNYEPSNCRWATPQEQSTNQRQRKDSIFKRLNQEVANKDVSRTREILVRMLRTNVQNLSRDTGLSLPTCYRILSGKSVSKETMRRVEQLQEDFSTHPFAY